MRLCFLEITFYNMEKLKRGSKVRNCFEVANFRYDKAKSSPVNSSVPNSSRASQRSPTSEPGSIPRSPNENPSNNAALSNT